MVAVNEQADKTEDGAARFTHHECQLTHEVMEKGTYVEQQGGSRVTRGCRACGGWVGPRRLCSDTCSHGRRSACSGQRRVKGLPSWDREGRRLERVINYR